MSGKEKPKTGKHGDKSFELIAQGWVGDDEAQEIENEKKANRDETEQGSPDDGEDS